MNTTLIRLPNNTVQRISSVVRLMLFLIFASYCFLLPGYAWADTGVEFGAEDDLTVSGTAGTDADPDVEVKGFAEFGASPASTHSLSGQGAVLVGGSLEVDGSSYFDNAISVAGAGDTNIAHDLYLSNATASQIYSNKALTIISGAVGQNLDLSLQGRGTGRVYVDDNLYVAGNLQVTGDFTLPSVSIPAGGTLTFGGDTDLFRLGANNLKTNDSLDIAGNLHVTGAGPHYISQGNFGIGATNPGVLLQVRGAAPKLFIQDTSNAGPVLQFSANDGAAAGGVGYNVWGGGSLELFTGGFSASNSRVFIKSDGKVGIGTTNPTEKLYLVGSGTNLVGNYNVNSAFVLDETNKRGIYLGYDSAAQSGFVSPSSAGAAANLAFLTFNGSAWAERMRIQSDGNVGIGTASINSLLHVEKALAATLTELGRFRNTTADSQAILSLVNDAQTWSFVTNGQDSDKLQIRGLNNDFAQIAMTIDKTNGNVGIGTAAPQRQLHIADTSTSFLSFTDNTTGHTMTDGTLTGIQADSSYQIWNYENAYIRFGVNADEKVRITSGGNVGIGRTSPAARLDIIGAGTSTGNTLRVSNSLGSDIFNLTDNGNVTFATYPATVNFNNAITTGFNSITVSDTGNGEGYMFPSNGGVSVYTVAQGGYDAFVFDTVTGYPFVFNGGNVGIGVTSPAYKLQVTGDIDTTTGTYRMAGTDYGQFFINSAGSNLQVWTSDGSGRGYWNMVDVNDDDDIAVEKDDSVIDASTFILDFKTPLTVTTDGAIEVDVDVDVGTGANQVAAGNDSRFHTRNLDYALAASDGSPTDAMYADATGNFGIGRTNPAQKLEISDGNIVLHRMGPNGSYYLGLGGGDGTIVPAVSGGSQIEFEDATNGATDEQRIHFLVHRSGVFHNRVMSIVPATSGGGNVGIGLTNPAQALHVAGNVLLASGNHFIARYDASDNYRSSLNWSGLQLGNNGNNDIVAGRNNVNGYLRFYVNNTNDYPTAPNGILASTITAGGNTVLRGTTPVNSAVLTVYVPESQEGIRSQGTVAGTKFQDISDYAYYVDPQDATTSAILNGKVGIGTTNPQYKLHVIGTLDATTITQGGTGVSLTTHNHGGTYEPVIPGGTSAQYWRGDKTWQTLNTAAVPESGSLYYTDARARAAFSGTSPITYNSGTGAIGINLANTSTNGYLSSTDWNTFNGKLSAGGTLTGLVQSVGSGTSYFTGGNVGIGTNNPGTANLAVMGKVGIGRTSPDYKLEVAGGHILIDNNQYYMARRQQDSLAIALMGIDTSNYMTIAPSFSQIPAGIKFFLGTSTELMRLTTTGLGIGTTAPASALDVASGRIRVSGVTTPGPGVGTEIGWNGTEGFMIAYNRTSSAYQPIFIAGSTVGLYGANGSAGIYINNSGSVGIGNTAPEGKLYIDKDTNMISGGENDFAVKIEDGTSDTGILLGVDAANNFSGIQSMDPGNDWTTRPLVLMPRGGNVGIGKTNPTAKLGVNGNITFETDSSNIDKGLLWKNGSDASWGRIFRDAATGKLQIDSQSTTHIALNANNTTGNVGIGTTNPLAKLHVTGSLGLANNTQLLGRIANDSGWTQILNYTASNRVVLGAGSDLTIDGNKVGIGVGDAAPGYKLDVQGGDVRIGAPTIGWASGNPDVFVQGNLEIDATAYFDGVIMAPTTTSAMSVGPTGTPGLMVAANNGNVGIGTSAPTRKLDVRGDLVAYDSGSEGTYLGLFKTAGSLTGYPSNRYPTLRTDHSCIYFDAASTYTGYICNSGGFTDVSDETLKTNIRNIDGALGIVSQINGVRFAWKDGRDGGQDHIGVTAQNVEKVAPEIVSQPAGIQTKGVNYQGLAALAIEAIKELDQRTKGLETTKQGNLVINDNVGIGTNSPSYTLEVNGSFSAASKSFDIPHPLDPKKKRLVHGSLEGPELAVYYRGEAKLVNSQAVVELPAYFEALAKKEGRTVYLTAKGIEPYLLSAGEVAGGKFKVFGTKPDGEFYWEVKAVRADIAPLRVERLKTEGPAI